MTNATSPDLFPNQLLSRPLTLPNGTVLKNRLMKSAMSDSLGDGKGNATETQIRLYERWAEGGVALSIIGEVQVDSRFPEKPGNLVLGPGADLTKLRELTRRGSMEGAHIWPQLGHAGALACRSISQPKGPSELNLAGLQCEVMTLKEVQQLPEIYANSAQLAKEVGFTGLQIHAGHGFLLSQFLSPLFNHRSDCYGGAIAARCRIIVEIIDHVRQAVGPAYPIGIKINSSDQLEGGLTEEDALEAIRILDQTSIDLIEISGGTYFPGAKASSDRSTSGAYFVDFTQRVKAITQIPIVATGGFKSRTEAIHSLSCNAVDMVGIARAMVLNPSLPNDWLSGKNTDPEFPRFSATVPGGITAWYTMRLTALGNDSEEGFMLDQESAIQRYEARDNKRGVLWQKRFTGI